MKTVFILGAGASRAAGAPLMADFIKTARNLHTSRAFGESSTHIQNVLDAAYRDLKPVLVKSNINMGNIEELFSAIDIGHLIHSFGSRDPASIAELRRSIVVFIYRTIEETVSVPVTTTGFIRPPGDYEMLGRLARSKIEKTAASGRNDVSFITFNYDTCLEYGLVKNGIGVDYGLGEPFLDRAEHRYQVSVPVLKLHGSINWGHCPKCKKIVPTEIDPWRTFSQIQIIDMPMLRLDLGSRIARQSHSCGSPLDHDPVIVPPTWNKSASTESLTAVWRKAAGEIGSAENIVVIGYSFPKTDMFFKYLFALGSHSDAHLENFLVINGPNSGAATHQFRDLLGPMSSDGFRYYEFLLSGSEHLIQDMLDR